MRECFCFGSKAVNASGEAVRGLVKSRVEFHLWLHGSQIPRGLCPRKILQLRRRSPAHASRQLRRLTYANSLGVIDLLVICVSVDWQSHEFFFRQDELRR